MQIHSRHNAWTEVPTRPAAMEATTVYRPRSSPMVAADTISGISTPTDAHWAEYPDSTMSMAMADMLIRTTLSTAATTAHVTMNPRITRVRSCPPFTVPVTPLVLSANTDEKIIDYDPNDPNLVDEPYLDVENPYEGLGPGRSDMIGRALLPTGGRQSPDSIGQGNHTAAAAACSHRLPSSRISAPPGYGEDYGTLGRMYAPYGLADDDYHARRRSPSIDTEFRGRCTPSPAHSSNTFPCCRSVEQRWRDPDLQEVIEYLGHTSDVIKENAAAYLQHLCYNDDNIKSKTRSLNGIAYLVALLQHEKPEIQKNACGALRNLCYGKRNDENKVRQCFEHSLRCDPCFFSLDRTEEPWRYPSIDPSPTPNAVRRRPRIRHCRALERLVLAAAQRTDSRRRLERAREEHHHSLFRLGRGRQSPSESSGQISSRVQERHWHPSQLFVSGLRRAAKDARLRRIHSVAAARRQFQPSVAQRNRQQIHRELHVHPAQSLVQTARSRRP